MKIVLTITRDRILELIRNEVESMGIEADKYYICEIDVYAIPEEIEIFTKEDYDRIMKEL